MEPDVTSRQSHQRHALPLPGTDMIRASLVPSVWALLALVGLTVWCYWPTLGSLLKEWQHNNDYSAGQLVPPVALFLVWRDRKTLGACMLRPCWWGGIVLLLLAQTARFYGLLFMFESADRYSLVLTIAGLVLLVAGWQVVRRVSWILLFLLLMIPLPGRLHNLVSGPLQSIATSGAVFLMEVFLPQVSQQGNVVVLNENTRIAVVEACSGLRMLTAFIIVAAFIAYMVRRPRAQKGVLLLSSIPVAVACNVIRILATAVLMLVVSADVAQKFFHDFAGFIMMPAAVLLIFGELWLMDKLIVPEPQGQRERAGR